MTQVTRPETSDAINAQASAKQRQAADPDASVWVSASAGSGKTKVLIDRVLSLLLTGSDPGKVLCLTFTKAAAAEMATRLSGQLAGWVTAEDATLRREIESLLDRPVEAPLLERARALFARVLDTPGGIKILTIHAFCQSLLGRFPLEAGVAPHAQVLGEHEAAELLEAARLEVLAQALSGQGRLSEAIGTLTAHLQEQRFTEVVKKLIDQRGRFAELLEARGGVDRLGLDVFALLGVDPDDSDEGLVAAACAEGAFDRAGLRLAADALAKGTPKTDQPKGAALATWLAAEAPTRVADFESYIRLFLKKDGEPFVDQLTRKLAAANPEAAEAMQSEAQRLQLTSERRNALTVAKATRALLILGRAIMAAYQRHKEARVMLDYDDLIHFSLRLLRRQGGVSWVLYKLDGGLDHILVDEAQDTSPDQWRIVELLTGDFFTGAGAGQERSDRPRTVFAVGDPKQSIYSFQRADPAAFEKMRRLFERRAHEARLRWRPVSLAVSFRSTEAVLRLVDEVFAAAEAQDGVLFGEAAIRHEAQRVGDAGLVELWPPAPPAETADPEAWSLPLPGRQDSPAPQRLARLVARRIWYWTLSPEGATDPACQLAAQGRRITPGDVMVLVRRRNSFIVELVSELKKRGVPVTGIDRMRLTEQLAVMDLVALGRVLLQPEDDLTLATVLKGPFLGLSEEALFELAYDRGEASLWDRLRRFAQDPSVAAAPAYARARDFLTDLAARADYVAPFELYSALLGAGRGREQLLARLGPDAADPIEEFLSLALAYERENSASLEGFLHWLMAGEIVIKRDLEQAHGAVRLMTVHGAKGLEAPVVILPDTLQLPQEDDGLLWLEDTKAPPSLSLWPVKTQYDQPAITRARAARRLAQQQEYRRLLYVALTRAKDRLYVCGWETKTTVSSGSWYHLVDSALSRLAEVGEAEALDFDFAAEIAEGWCGPGWRFTRGTAAEGGTAAAADETAEREIPALPDWAYQAAPAEPVPPQPLAPSRPSESEPAVHSPLARAAAGAVSERRFKRGRLIHRLLQTLPDLPTGEREAAGRRFLDSPLHALDPEAAEEILAEVLAVLAEPSLAALFGPGSRAEVPVTGVIATVAGDQVISGQIDRLLIEDRTISLIDFKSQRPAPESPDSVPRLYVRQMAAYRALLAAIYPGREIRSFLLWTDHPRLMQLSDALLAGHAP